MAKFRSPPPNRPVLTRSPHGSRYVENDNMSTSSPTPTIGPPSEKVLRVAGLPAVTALFRRSPDRVLRFFYEDQMVPLVGEFCSYLARQHLPYRKVDSDELIKIAGTILHGGIVAIAEPFQPPTLPLREVQQWASAQEPLIFLDGVGNPHNLGAISRTLAFFGFKYLALSDHPGQASLSDAAYRVAEGGLDCLSIYRVSHLPAVLRQIRSAYRVVGTALTRKAHPLESLRGDSRPIALVFGNEEGGLSSDTLEACDTIVTLRGEGSIQSLNVSATAAILAYVLRPTPDMLKKNSPQRGEYRR